ncbi:MAG: TonB-dependent receptor [Geobacteraceae bacterium]|nr:TonB-dependent receptor [Geobacteraceae bacterium]
MKRLLSLLGVVLYCAFSASAYGQDAAERLDALENAVKSQARTIEQQQKTIDSPSTRPDLWSRQLGGSRVRLMDISMDALFAAGASSEDDESLQTLQGGGHDPRKRGFTVQNIELSLMGAVDPYLSGESHIIFFIDPLSGETQVELEEIFLTTQSLPFGLQLEAGHFFTEFGRINPKHPHQWHWQDQPVINTRLFGPDGMRGPGFRLGWLTPLPWFAELHLGAQNAGGETMASFLASEEFFAERAIGGRPFVDRGVKNLKDLVYLARLDNSWDLTDELSAKLGFSGLYGPNASGAEAETLIYGADLLLKWRPENNDRGWPFLTWESEIMRRDYRAASFRDDSDPADVVDLAAETLKDWGLYSQLLYGFQPGWAAGVRYEYAAGSGDSVGGRDADPFRDDRHRVSPLLAWHPSEFSRLRLQYNYDRADHLEDREAHSVWLGVEFMYGAHPAHTY